MLLLEKVDFRTHKGKGSAQFVGCVSCELALDFESFLQPFEHLVDRFCQALEFGDVGFFEAGIRKVFRADAFCLLGEVFQGA